MSALLGLCESIVFTCADPGIFLNVCVCGGGGGRGVGVQAQLTEKSDNVFCYFLFAYFTVGVQWLISRKTIIFQGSREDPTSFRGISLTIQSANDH